MGLFDFISGGNCKISSKSTIDIFNDGVSRYTSLDQAYRYTYIFRSNTIVKHLRSERDGYAAVLFQQGKILNCTYITAANLNTGAAPRGVYFQQTYQNFHKKISQHLRVGGMPEKYISGNNVELIADILPYLCANTVVSSDVLDQLVMFGPQARNSFDEKSVSGGKGRSFADAVIVHAPNSEKGVVVEYAFIEKIFGKKNEDWKLASQVLKTYNSKHFDVFRLVLKGGKDEVMYFDISEFYGKY